jgi:predicted TPR repeat methyltransferase
MDHTAIAAAYDDIADRWLNDRFNQSNGILQHERALGFLEPGAGGWALNVGCGCNTRFNALIRDHGIDIEGIDISERMIALAREADPTVLLHHTDVCEWQPQRQYRFISAWDSIWHVRLEQQRPLMLKLMQALEAGGAFIFSAGGLDAESEHVDTAMGPEIYYSTLGIPGLIKVLADAGCICRHLEFDQYPEKHLCIVAQRI